MRFSTVIPTVLFGVAQALQNYQLVANQSAPTFFDHYTFFPDADPTAGFVKYQTMLNANATGLAGFASSDQWSDQVYLGVDASSVAQDGRPSVRIQSNDVFNSSTLLIADIRHHPGSICGVWSAFWLVGPKWPTGGEVDLMENINMATTNKYVLHTGPNLSVLNLSDPAVANSTGMNMRGSFSNLNCTAAAEGSIGCAVGGQPNTFGAGWNDNGGGTIAMEYLPEAISVWQFPRTEIPGDILDGTPSPSTWRNPDAHFMAIDGESLEPYFNSLQTVFNTDICGSWIDKIWTTSECASLAPSCAVYAAQNASAFRDAYWLIGSVTIYQPGPDLTNATAVPAIPAMNVTAHSPYHRRVRRPSTLT
jgi:hypothetical protein